MSYTVFKNNNKSITAPNESGEIVLKSSIPRQIRIEVDRNEYKFYAIIEKKYLTLSEIEAINPEECIFTAIIYPCGEILNPALVDNEENYPILYKFVDSCLGSTFSDYPIASFNGMYCSNNNIYFEENKTKLEFEFSDFIDVKIRLNISPSGLAKQTSFRLTSDDVEIISLFQHNITIDASRVISGGTNTKYIYSLSFSFINNRYEQYDENVSGLSTKDKVLSMIQDLSQGKQYPASGLIYVGNYNNGSNNMSITVHTIRYVFSTGSSLTVNALFTGKESGLSSSNNVDYVNLVFTPSLMEKLIFSDDRTQLS